MATLLPRWLNMRSRRERHRPPPGLPAGLRVYAVGDIHGRSDLLDMLHKRIAEDVGSMPANGRCAVVYLGDYIDRGPDSRGTIDRLIQGPPAGCDAVFLCGNHDDFLLRFLEDPSIGPQWLANGGDATLASYGVAPPDSIGQTGGDGWKALSGRLLRALPDSHRQFLRRLRYSHAEGDYFFVHAGVRPHVRLDLQDARDLMWIRDDFLNSKADFGKVVVHGHTPVEKPDIQANRIGVDTGAVFSDRLTCVVLDGRDRRFLATA